LFIAFSRWRRRLVDVVAYGTGTHSEWYGSDSYVLTVGGSQPVGRVGVRFTNAGR
jgi:hypothetical protein